MFSLFFIPEPMLLEGRSKLIENENGVRNKIKTLDANEIDTLFIDNREKGPNGKTLVVCSEGNAAFYEIGIMITPIALKYSVLGWNHPGFGGSSVSDVVTYIFHSQLNIDIKY